MFEAQTYEAVLDDVLSRAPEGIDIRQGSIYFDAVAGICFKIAKYYADLEQVFNLIALPTATGDHLTLLAEQFGVYRQPAVSAKYKVTFEGTIPQPGTRYFCNGHYFVLVDDTDLGLYLEAETPGSAAGDIPTGTAVVPVDNIAGLTAASIAGELEPGSDVEEDDDLRLRVQEKISGPAENGNIQHYKTWCESVAGVGRARIVPLWAGENTVKGILIDPDGAPAGPAVVERVQEYIDPGATGLGEGVANIGAHFTAAAATPVTVDISFAVHLSAAGSLDEVTAAAKTAIAEHIKELNLTSTSSADERIILRISAVGNIIYGLAGVLDYTDLQFNGQASNVEITAAEVFSIGEVTAVAANTNAIP